MAVLAFQFLIVLTVLVTRAAAPRHVLTVCFWWTAFTVLAVFTSRLMILQMITIWTCYLVMRPRGLAKAGAATP